MNTRLFEGKLIRLTAPNPETDAQPLAAWTADSEYMRLLDMDPARPATVKRWREELEREGAKDRPNSFFFSIRTLSDDKLIGFVGLWGLNWAHGDTFLGIGLGDREYWGRGYGTDAMRVILRYAFTELNLYRVSLDVFEYNTRAIRSYEKVGFVVEGRARRVLHRDGQRWDEIFMGILREEWQATVDND